MRNKASTRILQFPGIGLFLSTPLIGLQTSPNTQAPGFQTAVPTYDSYDIAGDWQGTLEFPMPPGRPSARYRLVLRIAKTPDATWTALNDSVDQGSERRHASGVSRQGRTSRFWLPSRHGGYERNV